MPLTKWDGITLSQSSFYIYQKKKNMTAHISLLVQDERFFATVSESGYTMLEYKLATDYWAPSHTSLFREQSGLLHVISAMYRWDME